METVSPVIAGAHVCKLIPCGLALHIRRVGPLVGATGSGKSSFLRAVILSLALQYTPNEVTISILDPKGLDFGAYIKLPHVGANRSVDEPEACIEYLNKILEHEMPARKAALRKSGYPSVQQHNEEAVAEDYDTIPHHVIIIDEYADLSMSAGKAASELEQNVCRLAQVGRAFGYSIILATQRPSVDIVSGKIKANFPCRISFRLPTRNDSQVILDEAGAEDLLGNGDAIVKSSSSGLRVQGYYVPTAEEMAIIAHLTSTRPII
ncbi:FtsK/SpoIIIE domain-containing protein [Gimesia sp.]|uniref:FtsK/SpoIIIE domain-containing protein n=1 Tax=Gimesia sp. TaxID=2024833 RepID=UPI0032EF85A2